MTTSDQMATALLTEHFRFTPLTLLDDIINTVNELVFRAVNAVEDGLTDASPTSLGFTAAAAASNDRPVSPTSLTEAKDSEIAAGVVQLESLLNATVDKDFDKFELYTLRNILAVGHAEEGLAPWVQLAHYRDVAAALTGRGGSEAEETAGQQITPEQVQLARRKLHETTKLNGLLRAEEVRNEAVLGQLRALIGGGAAGGNGKGLEKGDAPLEFLAPAANTQYPLAHSVQYALAQVPALRALLEELRGAATKGTRSGGPARREGEEAEEKRRRYVETRTRRALERRGVEVDDAAAGVLEMAGGRKGRRMGRDEVEGLEAVVSAMRQGRDAMED